ncbi:acylphosphatase, partial [Lacticaseibacillus paracasei subsp. paracasei Lpp227]
MVKLAKQIVVRGRVQGVGFRWATKMIADNLDISGTIENRSDGSVFIRLQV